MPYRCNGTDSSGVLTGIRVKTTRWHSLNYICLEGPLNGLKMEPIAFYHVNTTKTNSSLWIETAQYFVLWEKNKTTSYRSAGSGLYTRPMGVWTIDTKSQQLHICGIPWTNTNLPKNQTVPIDIFLNFNQICHSARCLPVCHKATHSTPLSSLLTGL